MFAFLLLAASAHAASPAELARVRYLPGDEAVLAGAALLAADPSDVSAHVTWIQTRVQASPWTAPRVKALYARWLAEAPEDPVRRVALAWAGVLAAPEAEHGSVPGHPGPWCDEALALLAPLPEDPAVRGRALWLEQLVEERCDRDDTASRAALIAVAEADWHVRYAAVDLRLEDGVDADDVRAVEALLEADPWRADWLWCLWNDEAEGEGLEAARAAALAMAGGAVASDDPALVYAGYLVARAASRRDLGDALSARMEVLDARRFLPPWPEEGAEHTPPEPAHLGTLEERLAALGSHPPRDAYTQKKGGWHSERARLLEGLGRADEALGEWRGAYRVSCGFDSNLDYARAALALDRDLRRARHALEVAVEAYSERDKTWGDLCASLQDQRAFLAEALALRAEVQRRLGRREAARADAVHSLLVAETPAARLILGLAEAGHKYQADESFEHLSLGLAAGGSGIARLDADAEAALSQAWPDQGWWLPGGLAGWIALVAVAPATPETGEEHPAFPDLALTVEGVERPLSSFTGPLVVDLWATWCGPCREALPQVDLLARTHPEITFIAVSVDDEAAAPAAYLAETTSAFVPAWAGHDAMAACGVSGIPAVFFLDPEHRIVAREGGYSPSGSGLDDGLAKLLEVLGR
jgi:thiol-disulfide isomerase/thioredoxin